VDTPIGAKERVSRPDHLGVSTTLRRAVLRGLGNLALLVGAVVFCGLVAETAARTAVWWWSSADDVRRMPLIEPHPTLGWAKPAGAAAWLRRSEYVVRLEINSHGLRGPERSYAKPPGVERVLLLGDSFTEGFGVAESDTVRTLLEVQLNHATSGRFEVINGGTTGYSTDQEYLFYLDQGRRYDPDIVVLFLYYNDLSDDTVGGLDKPRFDLVDGKLQLRDSPVPPPSPAISAWLRRGFRLKAWRGSMALRLLSDRTAAFNPGLHQKLVGLGLAAPARATRSIPGEFWPFRPARQLGRGPWRKPSALLGAIHDAVSEDGARFVVFYVPVRFEIDDDAWQRTRENYSLGRRWTRDGAIDWLREICTKRGVPLIDPRAAMRWSQQQGRASYFENDGHWNEVGHAIAAREIATRLTGASSSAGRTARIP
jgi:hypothetical protein